MKKFKITIFYLILASAWGCKENGNDQPEAENPWVAEPTGFDININHGDNSVVLQYAAADTIQVSGFLLNGEELPAEPTGETALSGDELLPGLNKLECYYTHSGTPDTLRKEFVFAVKKGFELVKSYPHNPEHFTQGLYFDSKGNLVESTGMEGRSKIIFYRQAGGFTALDSIVNDPAEFGEGVAEKEGEIIQLFWRNRYIKVYNSNTRKLLKTLPYNDEGWGICTDGRNTFTSNGTYNIKMIDLTGKEVAVQRTLTVTGPGGKVNYLNELEYIDGFIYANVWQSNTVMIIEPGTGAVVAEIDLSEFVNRERSTNPNADVLNGIAWNRKTGNILITGKQWNSFYELRVVDKKPAAPNA